MKTGDTHSECTWTCTQNNKIKSSANWKKVNCKECLNSRYLSETSMIVFDASAILNCVVLMEMRARGEERTPWFKTFREKNSSDFYNGHFEKFNRISKKTSKLKTSQERLDYVRTLRDSYEKRTIISVAGSWFRSLK